MSAEEADRTAMRELHDLIPDAGPLDEGAELFEWPCSIHRSNNCTAYATRDESKIYLCCNQGGFDSKEYIEPLNLPRGILRKVCALLGLSPDLNSEQANTDEPAPAAATPPKASNPRAEIERCSNLLCQPGEVYELRALETQRSRVVSGYYNDLSKLAEDAWRCTKDLKARGTYLILLC